MDHAEDVGDDDDVFVYMGGNQRVPRDVRYVRVHKSVKNIPRRAFSNCIRLISIEMHDGVEIIGEEAFSYCRSLRGINLPGVRVIGDYAFYECRTLTDVEFGDNLETIGERAFGWTSSLRSIKIPKVRVIGKSAFVKCDELTDVELSEDLETIGNEALSYCRCLRHITMPLKDNLLSGDVFFDCDALSQVDLVGGIHKTISSLLLESWRNDMGDEIDRINQVLPNVNCYQKTNPIRNWMERVLDSIEHYKIEHYALLKKFTTLLELALWKAKIDESQDDITSLGSDQPAKNMKTARQEKRITSGANIVIKNVLPFLKLE